MTVAAFYVYSTLYYCVTLYTFLWYVYIQLNSPKGSKEMCCVAGVCVCNVTGCLHQVTELFQFHWFLFDGF